jgi:hypothetical protein
VGNSAYRTSARAERSRTLESTWAVPQQHRYPEALEIRVVHIRRQWAGQVQVDDRGVVRLEQASVWADAGSGAGDGAS